MSQDGKGRNGPGPGPRASARPGRRAGIGPGSTDNIRVRAGFEPS
jgi:hypothetical protein